MALQQQDFFFDAPLGFVSMGIAFLLFILAYAWARENYQDFLQRSFLYWFSPKRLQKEVPTILRADVLFLHGLFLCMLSMSLVLFFYVIQPSIFQGSMRTLAFYGLVFCLGFLLYFLAESLLLRILGYLLDIEKSNQVYYRWTFVSRSGLGILLLGLNIMTYYTRFEWKSTWVAITLTVLILTAFVLKWLNYLSISRAYKVPYLYIIFYICTFEILPFWTIAHWIKGF